MSIHDEIIKLRTSLLARLSNIAPVPTPKPYGYIYTANLIVGGVAVVDLFKFNPHTYANDGAMDEVLRNLVVKAGLIEGEVGHVECTEGVLNYLLVPEDEDTYSFRRKTFYNGVTAPDDRKQLTIPGTGIRYTVKKPGAKRQSNDWKYLDESVLITINAISEWKDSETDAENAAALNEWTVEASRQIEDASGKMAQLDKLVEKALLDTNLDKMVKRTTSQ